jgi:rhomboid protease GluP
VSHPLEPSLPPEERSDAELSGAGSDLPQSHPLSDARPAGIGAPPRRRGAIILAEPSARLTQVLVALNVVIFIITLIQSSGSRFGLAGSSLFQWGALAPNLVFGEGQWYRLLSAMFLHGSAPHILFNMLALYSLGGELERLFGRSRFALVYFLGGLAGSVLSALIGDYAIPSVGASGAIFAVWSAHTLHFFRHRDIMGDFARATLQNAAFFMLVNLLIGFTPGSNIDNWGHIGGAVGGVVLSFVLGPRYSLHKVIDPLSQTLKMSAQDDNPLDQRQAFPLGAYVVGLGILLAVGLLMFNAQAL